MENKKNETVLITGATSGIGLELAKIFASHGYNMVLVARFPEELKLTEDMLKVMGAQQVVCIAKDLSVPGAAAEVYDEARGRGLEVNILVNDAGAGVYGFFTETELEKELDIIQLNIASLVHLTKLFLKDMVRKGEGRILQLASVASEQPTPKLAVYAATKAFVLSFSDALVNELKETAPGVTMTALLPNATDTDFFNKAGMENTKAAQNDPEDPAEVAKAGFEALMKGEPRAYGSGVKTQIAMGTFKSNQSIAASARKQMEEVKDDKKNSGATGKA